MNYKSHVIGVAGGTGSGKTYIVDSIRNKFGNSNIAVVSMDDYYKPIELQPVDKKGVVNFDNPSSIYVNKLKKDIDSLTSGKQIQFNKYTFNNIDKIPERIVLEPRPILLVEGLFLFSDRDLLKRFSLKVFIKAGYQTMLSRRLKRDMQERGYNSEDVKYRFQHHVLPAHKNWIEKGENIADIVIYNDANISPDLNNLVGKINKLMAG